MGKAKTNRSKWTTTPPPGIQDLPTVGKLYWFEYHCWESHQSGDAKLWYRSHTQATVLGYYADDSEWPTIEKRCEQGEVLCCRVRFEDGTYGDVFEDELLDSRDDFCRPDPPKGPPPPPKAKT